VSPNESPHHNNIIINFKPLSRLLYSRPAAVVVVGWGVSASGEERKKKERKKERKKAECFVPSIWQDLIG